MGGPPVKSDRSFHRFPGAWKGGMRRTLPRAVRPTQTDGGFAAPGRPVLLGLVTPRSQPRRAHDRTALAWIANNRALRGVSRVAEALQCLRSAMLAQPTRWAAFAVAALATTVVSTNALA